MIWGRWDVKGRWGVFQERVEESCMGRCLSLDGNGCCVHGCGYGCGSGSSKRACVAIPVGPAFYVVVNLYLKCIWDVAIVYEP